MDRPLYHIVQHTASAVYSKCVLCCIHEIYNERRYAHVVYAKSSAYEGFANVFCLCAYSLIITLQLTS